MRIRANWVLLFILAANFFVCSETLAASLNGKVIAVNDGDEITIFNLNRPVRIRLVGIDAPEKDQAFGAAAKQHLFDLVYDKFVTVEYSGIGQHSSLIGRVVLNDSDICAQMIRDGAAWFDPKATVSTVQRDIYFQSEQAARNERRGLWQPGDAVAPWEFVKAEELKKNPVALIPTVSASQPVRRSGPTPELNSLSLLKTGTALPRSAGQGEINIESDSTAWLTDGPFRKTWRRLQPSGENFSALIPAGGEQTTKSIPLGDRNFEATYYRARDGNSIFELVWFKAPTQGESDDEALVSGLNSILKGVASGAEGRGGRFQCDPTSRRIGSTSGFLGREYDLTNCTIPGMARMFTKVEGDSRQFYLGWTFYKEEDENVMKFLKSFAINSPTKTSEKQSSR